MPAPCLPTGLGGMGVSPCRLPFPQTLKRRGVGLDGPELEPDEGLEGPGEKLRRLAGDGGDPALPRPRLYVSDPLSRLAWGPPPTSEAQVAGAETAKRTQDQDS